MLSPQFCFCLFSVSTSVSCLLSLVFILLSLISCSFLPLASCLLLLFASYSLIMSYLFLLKKPSIFLLLCCILHPASFASYSFSQTLLPCLSSPASFISCLPLSSSPCLRQRNLSSPSCLLQLTISYPVHTLFYTASFKAPLSHSAVLFCKHSFPLSPSAFLFPPLSPRNHFLFSPPPHPSVSLYTPKFAQLSYSLLPSLIPCSST